MDSLQGALSLQCVWHDAAAVRMAFALAAPLLPILVLIGCLVLETCRRGLGIAVALKAVDVDEISVLVAKLSFGDQMVRS